MSAVDGLYAVNITGVRLYELDGVFMRVFAVDKKGNVAFQDLYAMLRLEDKFVSYAKMIRKYHYVKAMPKNHLGILFKRRLGGKIPREDLEAIFNDFMKELILVMEWRYVEPHRYKPKASARPSKEDEGVLGELQSKAEDYGWGEAEEEPAEDGEWETIEELMEEGYFDEEY
ncbi:MAG: hypothetical protein QW186_08955 [Candidatus Bathyarchaeia archaeon]